VSLIALLGHLNGRMVILYHQFKRKKETNKQTNKASKKTFFGRDFSSITTLTENHLLVWICFALAGMASVLRLVRDWTLWVRTPMG